MLTTIDADTTQLFAGAKLTQDDPCECTACNRTLREGEQCTIYAARKEDAPTFRIERIYCRECTPEELTAPTLGLNEYLLESRLTRTLDVQTQSEFYTLHEPHPIATSAPSEGTAEAHDEPEEPSALIKDPRSQSPGRTVYHLDNGAGQPLCNCRGEADYTAVSLAEAETRPARRCQNCQIIHQGGQETRPCPHCSSAVKLSAWPQHVRACTGDPANATEDRSRRRSSDHRHPADDEPDDTHERSGSYPLAIAGVTRTSNGRGLSQRQRCTPVERHACSTS